MKKATLFTAALALLLTACCTKQQERVYTPEKTEPMELTAFETIKLQAPDTQSGDALLTTLKNRHTDREFSPANLSLKHLSELLWAANGVNREDGKRTVPSAMALYPLNVYAFLANGIYYYDPGKHELQPVVEGDHRALAGMQPFVEVAPLNLVFIADFDRYMGDRPIPQDKWFHMAALDAGHCTQSVYLYCASEGLKAVVRGMAPEEELLKLLNLEGNHRFIVAQTIGY